MTIQGQRERAVGAALISRVEPRLGLNSEKFPTFVVARARVAASAAGQREKGVDPREGKRNPKRATLHVLFTSYVRTGPYGSLRVLGNLVVSSSWKLEPTIETAVTIPRDTLGARS